MSKTNTASHKAKRTPRKSKIKSGKGLVARANKKIVKSASSIDGHVAKKVRQARKRIELTQKYLAKRLGLSYQQIQKYESGDTRISAGVLAQIAEETGVPVEFFFDGLESIESLNSHSNAQFIDLRQLSAHKAECIHLLMNADDDDALAVCNILSRMKLRER